MANSRHHGRPAADYDRKFDFVTPDARGGAVRTAGHRFIAAEKREAASSPSPRKAAEDFSEQDFKPRWWPAPDVWR